MRDSPFLCLLYVVLVALALTAPVQARHLGTASVASPVNTYLVSPGCAQPPNTQPGTQYYVDPTLGSDSNNGLAPGSGHAWATLAHAVSTVSTSAGDQINLYTGTYAAQAVGRVMSAFTAIVGVPGQTALFTGRLSMNGGQMWILRGLKFQDVRQSLGDFDPLLEINGTAHDIVAYGNDFSSAPFSTVQTWTQSQGAGGWVANARYTAIDVDQGSLGSTNAGCTALDANTIEYVFQGIQAEVDNIMIDSNPIIYSAGDYIDYAGSNIQISNNIGHDSIDNLSMNHADFIQGQTGRCTFPQIASFTGSISGTTMTVGTVTGSITINSSIGLHVVDNSGPLTNPIDIALKIISQLTGSAGQAGTYKVSQSLSVSSEAMQVLQSCLFSNITIVNNTGIELYSPISQVPFTTYTSSLGAQQQGISAFDADWGNVLVANNQIFNASDWGVSVISCHTCLLENNVGYLASGAGDGIGLEQFTHQGAASDHVTVRNNLGNYYSIGYFSATNSIDHNSINTLLAWDPNGSGVQFINTPGTYGTANVVTAQSINAGTITSYVTTTSGPSYNSILPGGSVGLGTGTTPTAACPNGSARGVSPNPNPPNQGAYC